MSKQTDEAPFAYDELDRVFHERARLGIVTALISHPNGLAFAALKELCNLSDGNLSRHLQVLEEASVVDISKVFERKRPLTTCRLTAKGRQRFLEYIAALEQVVRDATAAHGASSHSKPKLRPKPA